MSVRAATKIVQRMQADHEFRKKFVASYAKVIKAHRDRVLFEAKLRGCEFAPSELTEALMTI